MHTIIATKALAQTKQTLTTIRDTAVLKTSGFGECGEFSESLALLMQNGIYPAWAVAEVADNNHGYLLVDVTVGKDSEKETYAADPFLSVLCPKQKYLQDPTVTAYFTSAFGSDYSKKLNIHENKYELTEFKNNLKEMEQFIEETVLLSKKEADKANQFLLSKLGLNAHHHLLKKEKFEMNKELISASGRSL